MNLCAYAQGPKKCPFECMLKDPKNDPLSVRSRAPFGCTFLPHSPSKTFKSCVLYLINSQTWSGSHTRSAIQTWSASQT